MWMIEEGERVRAVVLPCLVHLLVAFAWTAFSEEARGILRIHGKEGLIIRT